MGKCAALGWITPSSRRCGGWRRNKTAPLLLSIASFGATRDSPFGQGCRLPRCRSAATDRGACRTQNSGDAKARIAPYAPAWSTRSQQPRQKPSRPDLRAFLDVLQVLRGFHKRHRSGALLPELREESRRRQSAPVARVRGAEGSGVGWRADLAEPHHPRPGARARPRPQGEPLAGNPHLQCLRLQ